MKRFYRDDSYEEQATFNVSGIPYMEAMLFNSMVPIDGEICQFCSSELFTRALYFDGEPVITGLYEECQEIVCKKCGVVKEIDADFEFKELKEALPYEDYKIAEVASPVRFLKRMIETCEKETVLEYLEMCIQEDPNEEYKVVLLTIDNVIFTKCELPNAQDNRAAQ